MVVALSVPPYCVAGQNSVCAGVPSRTSFREAVLAGEDEHVVLPGPDGVTHDLTETGECLGREVPSLKEQPALTRSALRVPTD